MIEFFMGFFAAAILSGFFAEWRRRTVLKSATEQELIPLLVEKKTQRHIREDAAERAKREMKAL